MKPDGLIHDLENSIKRSHARRPSQRPAAGDAPIQAGSDRLAHCRRSFATVANHSAEQADCSARAKLLSRGTTDPTPLNSQSGRGNTIKIL